LFEHAQLPIAQVEALANERDQITRLGALVAVGQETRVILDETTLLRRALAIASDAFVGDRLRVGIISAGRLHFDDDELLPGADRLYTRVIESGKPLLGANHLVLPLHVKGHGAGLLEAVRLRGSFAERDHYLLLSLASQLSTALENTRLYRQLDGLFRQYMPASVATALLADPSQAALGGAVQEITVLFADLRGFTTLAERMSPPELVALLNRYFGAATTVVLEQGGTIDKFMGDAMMALFNTPTRQPDHALRACRAALAMQQAIAPIAATAADLPRFGIGIASGRALVGNIGSEAVRNFTAIGDTVNLAARLQTRAAQGQVLLSGPLYAQVQAQAIVQPLGQLQLKGKAELVDTYALLGLRDE
jgi:class 3 adenylate cyclase